MLAFYKRVFDLKQREAKDAYVVLVNDSFELVLLRTATSKRMNSDSEGAAAPRQDTAMKPVFFVDKTIQEIRDRVISSGGGCKPGNKEWEFNGHRVCDGWDPEGNVFQVRSLKVQ